MNDLKKHQRIIEYVDGTTKIDDGNLPSDLSAKRTVPTDSRTEIPKKEEDLNKSAETLNSSANSIKITDSMILGASSSGSIADKSSLLVSRDTINTALVTPPADKPLAGTRGPMEKGVLRLFLSPPPEITTLQKRTLFQVDLGKHDEDCKRFASMNMSTYSSGYSSIRTTVISASSLKNIPGYEPGKPLTMAQYEALKNASNAENAIKTSTLDTMRNSGSHEQVKTSGYEPMRTSGSYEPLKTSGYDQIRTSSNFDQPPKPSGSFENQMTTSYDLSKPIQTTYTSSSGTILGQHSQPLSQPSSTTYYPSSVTTQPPPMMTYQPSSPTGSTTHYVSLSSLPSSPFPPQPLQGTTYQPTASAFTTTPLYTPTQLQSTYQQQSLPQQSYPNLISHSTPLAFTPTPPLQR